MPSYLVQFTDSSGGTGELSLTAPSLPALAHRLRSEGCTLSRVVPLRPDRRLRRYARSVSEGELCTLYRQLATMLGNGVALPTAVELQARETQNPVFRALLLDVTRTLQGGGAFSHALEAYPQLFSPLHTRLLEAAEIGGHLPAVLRDLAEYTERAGQASLRIRTALVYPQVVGAFTLALLALSFALIQPNFFALYKELGLKDEQLPLATRALQFFGGAVCPLLALVVPGAALGTWWAIRRRERQSPFHWAHLRTRIPVIGVLWENLALLRLTRLLAVLLRGGVPLLDALRLAGQGAESPLLQAAMWDAIPRVAAGESLAASFAHAGILPPTFIGQVAAAESGSDLPGALDRLAGWYSERVDYLAARVGALVEPIFILGLALLAGWVALGVLSPLITVIQSLSGGQ